MIIFINQVALAKQGENKSGSIRPSSVSPSVSQQETIITLKVGANLDHHQAKTFVCVFIISGPRQMVSHHG